MLRVYQFHHPGVCFFFADYVLCVSVLSYDSLDKELVSFQVGCRADPHLYDQAPMEDSHHIASTNLPGRPGGDLHPRIAVLQTAALLLRHQASL